MGRNRSDWYLATTTQGPNEKGVRAGVGLLQTRKKVIWGKKRHRVEIFRKRKELNRLCVDGSWVLIWVPGWVVESFTKTKNAVNLLLFSIPCCHTLKI